MNARQEKKSKILYQSCFEMSSKTPKTHKCDNNYKGVVVKSKKGITFCGQCGAEWKNGRWISNKDTDIDKALGRTVIVRG